MKHAFKNRVFRHTNSSGHPIGPWMYCTASTKNAVEGFATFEQVHPLYEHHNICFVQKKNCYFPEIANVQVELKTWNKIANSSFDMPVILRLHANKKNTNLFEKPYEVIRLYALGGKVLFLKVYSLCVCEDFETHERYIRIEFDQKIYEQE